MLPASAISRVTGVNVEFRDFNSGSGGYLPQRLAVFGVGNDDAVYSLDKYEALGDAESIGERFGHGSPLHLAARQLYPAGGGGANFPVTFYPLKKDSTGVKSTGTIGCTTIGQHPAGSGTVTIGGIDAEFPILENQNAAAILAAIKTAVDKKWEFPVTSGAVDPVEGELPIAAKWSGDTGNDIKIGIDADIEGVNFDITAMHGGAIDPDVAPVLPKIGGIWETFILSCFSYNKSTRLDAYQVFAQGRWAEMEKKPLLVAHGCTDDYATRTAVSDQRKLDYANFYIVSVGSPELPFVVAAKGITNIMNVANSNPPDDNYGVLTGLKAGPDEAQELYTVRNNSVEKGSSTNIKVGSVAELNDTVTFWHPENELHKSRRYVVDLIKLQNIVYNVRMIMESDEMKGAPLLSDITPTTNPRAVQPKTVKTSLMNLATSLSLFALMQEPEYTKTKLVVKISSLNPKRLDVQFPCKLSGNVEVTSTDIYFGFYLGAA
jgi:phage tail sheath gpL-like